MVARILGAAGLQRVGISATVPLGIKTVGDRAARGRYSGLRWTSPPHGGGRRTFTRSGNSLVRIISRRWGWPWLRAELSPPRETSLADRPLPSSTEVLAKNCGRTVTLGKKNSVSRSQDAPPETAADSSGEIRRGEQSKLVHVPAIKTDCSKESRSGAFYLLSPAVFQSAFSF